MSNFLNDPDDKNRSTVHEMARDEKQWDKK